MTLKIEVSRKFLLLEDKKHVRKNNRFFMQLMAVRNNKMSSTVLSHRRNGGDLPPSLPSFLSFSLACCLLFPTRQTPQAELLTLRLLMSYIYIWSTYS
jgi:hypothetical protein